MLSSHASATTVVSPSKRQKSRSPKPRPAEVFRSNVSATQNPLLRRSKGLRIRE
ncbi:unnamed protein product [Strongylus vulgaris]|uniref:Uncharacterized protein n=1 Tax=Strongylus vulgaris TaxID=40348 RepID=A0A3P7L812_STRVU|nr:unnamed protein product [Strongylus vulgaris]